MALPFGLMSKGRKSHRAHFLSLASQESIYTESEAQRDEAYKRSSHERQRRFAMEEKAQAQGEEGRAAAANNLILHHLAIFRTNQERRESSFWAADSRYDSIFRTAEEGREAVSREAQALRAAAFEHDRGVRAKHSESCVEGRERIIQLGRRRREEVYVKLRKDIVDAFQEHLRHEEEVFVTAERERDELVSSLLDKSVEEAIEAINSLHLSNTVSPASSASSFSPPDGLDKHPSVHGRDTTKPIKSRKITNYLPSSLKKSARGAKNVTYPTSEPVRRISASVHPSEFEEDWEDVDKDEDGECDDRVYEDDDEFGDDNEYCNYAFPILHPSSESLSQVSVPDEPRRVDGSNSNSGDVGPADIPAKNESSAGVPLPTGASVSRSPEGDDRGSFESKFAFAQDRRNQTFLNEEGAMQMRFEEAEDERNNAEAGHDEGYKTVIAVCDFDSMKLTVMHDKTFQRRESARQEGELRRRQAFDGWNSECSRAFQLEITHIQKQAEARDDQEHAEMQISHVGPLQDLRKEQMDLDRAARKIRHTKFLEGQSRRETVLGVLSSKKRPSSVDQSYSSDKTGTLASESLAYSPPIPDIALSHPWYPQQGALGDSSSNEDWDESAGSPAAGFVPAALFRGANIQDSLPLPSPVEHGPSTTSRNDDFRLSQKRRQYVFELSQDGRDTVFENAVEARREVYSVAEAKRELGFQKMERGWKAGFEQEEHKFEARHSQAQHGREAVFFAAEERRETEFRAGEKKRQGTFSQEHKKRNLIFYSKQRSLDSQNKRREEDRMKTLMLERHEADNAADIESKEFGVLCGQAFQVILERYLMKLQGVDSKRGFICSGCGSLLQSDIRLAAAPVE